MSVELNNTTAAVWNETDASNNSAPPDGAPGGMFPNQSEGVWRGTMGTVKRAWDRANGALTVGGTANAITLVTSNTTYPLSYVVGEIYQFQAAVANTSAVTIQINSLAVVSLYKKSSAGAIPLVGGEIQIGDMVLISYNGAQFQLLSGSTSSFSASSTDVLTNKTFDTAGTGNVLKINGNQVTAISGNTATMVSTTGTLVSGNTASFDANGNIQDSGRSTLGIAKAWAVFDGALAGTNAPIAGFNVTSITRNSTGNYSVNFTNSLSSANYAAMGMAKRPSPNESISVVYDRVLSPTTTQLFIDTVDNGDSVQDCPLVSITVFGL